jgi:CTP:phosphocholine cytidylyltransferase-like protein
MIRVFIDSSVLFAAAYSSKLADLEQVIDNLALEIIEEPVKDDILRAATYVNIKDAPVVAGAKKAGVEFLVTYDRKHLLSPPEVAEKSGLQIVTPEFIVKLLSDQNEPEMGNGES